MILERALAETNSYALRHQRALSTLRRHSVMIPEWASTEANYALRYQRASPIIPEVFGHKFLDLEHTASTLTCEVPTAHPSRVLEK